MSVTTATSGLVPVPSCEKPVPLAPARRFPHGSDATATTSALRLLGCRVVAHPEAPDAPFPMCFTEPALRALVGSVGRWPAETGAKAFGPPDRFGVDVVEFDHRGSARSQRAVYRPDGVWGAARVRHWLAAPDLRLWTGQIHSHPGGLGSPSGKVGAGLGDLGFVEAVFDLNETMQYFMIPILTGTGPESALVDIHPWIVGRDDPHRAMCAELRVCEPDRFPRRVFNSSWVRRIAGGSNEELSA